jgi:hypothetical protein
MFIRKTILLLVSIPLIGLFPLRVAIGKSDFTGTWIRDAGASDIFTAVAVPPIGPKRNSPGNHFLLRVNHQAKHLQVAIEQDGQKPTIADYDLRRGWHGGSALKLEYEFGGSRYRSKWKRDTLVIDKYTHFRGNFGTAGAKVNQVWSLSATGKILTIVTTTDGFITQEVFYRK